MRHVEYCLVGVNLDLFQGRGQQTCLLSSSPAVVATPCGRITRTMDVLGPKLYLYDCVDSPPQNRGRGGSLHARPRARGLISPKSRRQLRVPRWRHKWPQYCRRNAAARLGMQHGLGRRTCEPSQEALPQPVVRPAGWCCHRSSQSLHKPTPRYPSRRRPCRSPYRRERGAGGLRPGEGDGKRWISAAPVRTRSGQYRVCG